MIYTESPDTQFTSAGVPVPDFQERCTELHAEYVWRMKVYSEDIMPLKYPEYYPIKQKRENIR